MNCSKKLGLSLFVFLLFFNVKNCLFSSPKRKPSPILGHKIKAPKIDQTQIGRDRLDIFESADAETIEHINPCPWIGHLKKLGLNPQDVVARSAFYDEETLARNALEIAEFTDQEILERKLELLKCPLIEEGRRRWLLFCQIQELAAMRDAMQEEKSQILSQPYKSIEQEQENLTLLLLQEEAKINQFYWDKAAQYQQSAIDDFYQRNKTFCKQKPAEFEKYKQNLINNFFQIDPLRKNDIKELNLYVEVKRAEFKQRLFALSSKEFGLTET